MANADPVRVRTAQQRAGDAAEELVADRLRSAGWLILARKVHLGRAELDIVAIDRGPPAELVIVEVRWRRTRAFGLAEETFDHRKRAHLRMALARLLALARLPDGSRLPRLPVRGDLVVVEPAERAGDPPRVRHHHAALTA
jgi:putative endonuclease